MQSTTQPLLEEFFSTKYLTKFPSLLQAMTSYSVLRDSLFSYTPAWLAAGIATVLAIVWAFSVPSGAADDFLNDKKQHIKEIKSDVRLLKFVRSLQLSKQGEALAGIEPYLIRSGPYRELVISQPEHIHEFYKNDAKDHTKPKNFNLGELPGRLIGGAVGSQYGSDWRKIRKHFDPIFAFHPTIQNIPRFAVEVAQWTCDLASTPSKEIVARDSFKFFTFRLLALHLYGDAFDDRIYWRLLELNELHENFMRMLPTSRFPDSKLWNSLPTAANQRLKEFLKQWKEFNRMIIEHSRGGGWTCPVEVIYRGVDPDQDFSEDDFLSTLTEILFTNVDVSAGALSTIFTSLAQNPDIQLALRAEIAVSNPDKGIYSSTYLSKTDTLLSRVIMESMRLSPAFWFSMPESTSLPKLIGGYHIPAHTAVVIDTRRLNCASSTWGSPDSVDSFDPDRFLRVAAADLRCGFMRFGVGAASGRCLGKNVADLLFKMAVVGMLGRFELVGREKEKGEGRGGEGKEWDLKIVRL